MASVNQRSKVVEYTHEGGVAKRIDPFAQLSRSLNSCLLWEDEFYEDGEFIAQRIVALVQVLAKMDDPRLDQLIIDARRKIGLRHAPLLGLVALASVGKCPSDLIEKVLWRADDATELVALFWKLNDNRKLPASYKRAISRFLLSLTEYEVKKYASRRGEVRLRDLMFLTHPKAANAMQEVLFRHLAADDLGEAGTWENELSAGKDKHETWTRLLEEKKLGALALIRNLRNMSEAGVDDDLVIAALESANPKRIFPYQIIQAWTHAPRYQIALERFMFKSLEGYEKLAGKTAVLVDISGSMSEKLSSKGDMTRRDAAKALAVLLREVCESTVICLFNEQVFELQGRLRGFDLYKAIPNTGGGTRLWGAVQVVIKMNPSIDRIICITDEQTADNPCTIGGIEGYMVNVASARNGVGYGGQWTHIDGFSSNIVEFIVAHEKE